MPLNPEILESSPAPSGAPKTYFQHVCEALWSRVRRRQSELSSAGAGVQNTTDMEQESAMPRSVLSELPEYFAKLLFKSPRKLSTDPVETPPGSWLIEFVDNSWDEGSSYEFILEFKRWLDEKRKGTFEDLLFTFKNDAGPLLYALRSARMLHGDEIRRQEKILIACFLYGEMCQYERFNPEYQKKFWTLALMKEDKDVMLDFVKGLWCDQELDEDGRNNLFDNFVFLLAENKIARYSANFPILKFLCCDVRFRSMLYSRAVSLEGDNWLDICLSHIQINFFPMNMAHLNFMSWHFMSCLLEIRSADESHKVKLKASLKDFYAGLEGCDTDNDNEFLITMSAFILMVEKGMPQLIGYKSNYDVVLRVFAKDGFEVGMQGFLGLSSTMHESVLRKFLEMYICIIKYGFVFEGHFKRHVEPSDIVNNGYICVIFVAALKRELRGVIEMFCDFVCSTSVSKPWHLDQVMKYLDSRVQSWLVNALVRLDRFDVLAKMKHLHFEFAWSDDCLKCMENFEEFDRPFHEEAFHLTEDECLLDPIKKAEPSENWVSRLFTMRPRDWEKKLDYIAANLFKLRLGDSFSFLTRHKFGIANASFNYVEGIFLGYTGYASSQSYVSLDVAFSFISNGFRAFDFMKFDFKYYFNKFSMENRSQLPLMLKVARFYLDCLSIKFKSAKALLVSADEQHVNFRMQLALAIEFWLKHDAGRDNCLARLRIILQHYPDEVCEFFREQESILEPLLSLHLNAEQHSSGVVSGFWQTSEGGTSVEIITSPSAAPTLHRI